MHLVKDGQPIKSSSLGNGGAQGHHFLEEIPTGIINAIITLHHNYKNSTTLQLQLHYTTLHPAVVGKVTDQVTTATTVTTPKNATPTTFQSISGFTLPSVIHNNQALL